jgi:hypothetical protein
MNTIETVRNVLDQQTGIAIWYAEYEGRNECIQYVNNKFAETFELSVDEILNRKKYVLVNPPETTAATIEQYKNEDFAAMQHGSFVSRSRISPEQDIIVVKLPIEQGILGFFKIVHSAQPTSVFSLTDLDDDLREIVRLTSPHLLK